MMRHGWQFVFLIVSAVALTGCGNKNKTDSTGPARWQSFPVAIYTDPAIVSNAQSQADFQDAMSFWEEKIGKKIFDYKGNWSGQTYTGGNAITENALYASTPWSYASNIAAQTTVLSQQSQIQGAVIMVNPNTSFCGGDCTGNNSSTSMRKVFAHELGHFIGLGHVQDTANIMYPDALPGGSLNGLTVSAAELLPLVN